MEAPDRCSACPMIDAISDDCPHIIWDMKRESDDYSVPGPECPFVLLAAKDAEIEKLRTALKNTLDELELRCDEDESDEMEFIERNRALGGVA